MWGNKSYIPDRLYRFLPVVYVAAGVTTLSLFSNIYGTMSGILFVTAGALVLIWRNKEQRQNNRRRPPTPRSRSAERTNRDALEYPADRSPVQEVTPSAPAPATDSSPQEATPSLVNGDPVTSDLLSRFSPFRELNDSLRRMFVGDLSISLKPRGSTLVHRGSDDDIAICLVEGALRLEAADGRRVRVSAGTPSARRPLCMLRPHAYCVTSLTDVAVIILSQEMVNEVTRIVAKYHNSPAIQVSEQPEDANPGYADA